MMKKIMFLILLAPVLCRAQHVSQTDWKNFWTMRDRVSASSDTARQLAAVNRLYIGNASEGLKAFMRNKDGLDRKWLALLKSNPGFWDTLQRKQFMVNAAVRKLERQIARFQKLYPGLKPARSYFIVGLQRQGGTVRGSLSLIGVEVVLNDPEMTGDQLVRMGIHEYTHTQQKRPDFQHINVLTSAIREGACDFVAKQVTGIPMKTPYMAYGPLHEKEVWHSFRQEMYTQNNDNWVSTGQNPALPAPDLGYFIGYRICQAYYDQAKDKKAALKEIIELDYANPVAVDDFFKRSGYQGGRSGN
ncbi:DUF2268 domain-containing putative Zn-dependent protease [Mucilaginibacter sp. NFR10]|uniref:DUF2268 domain-containing putative Zn-dependent protease n=1 Tax=Mucilaginibacter sp. NFR10 TaxID=1566292 RepID=UPI000B832AC0|nr:DUF2268 domain-containing putative Zn-dependent protease [Mucilaginibacter sp. NFR10]